jgi:glycosyltransferase involved in cell wall biosynthesis
MSLSEIHPVIIARDAATTIRATLESLAVFPEVIVYDNGSADGTPDLCARFSNVRLVHGEFLGFGPTKNRAASFASGPWILSVDADERVSPELLSGLGALDLPTRGDTAYAVDRHNFLLGKHVRRGGWGDDWLVRLYDRRVCAFDDAQVHEKVDVPPDVRIERVPGALWHEAVTDLDQFLHKISLYSELRRSRGGRVKGPFAATAGAAWAFFRSYVLQTGFLEGWRGLVIANCNAQGSFFRHMKRFVDAQSRRSLGSGHREAEPPRSPAAADAGRTAAAPFEDQRVRVSPRGTETANTACNSARIESAMVSGESAPMSSPTGPRSRSRNLSAEEPSAASSRSLRAGGPSTPK